MKLPLVLLLLLGSLAPSRADGTEKITIKGRVINAIGRKPVENASISALGQNGRSDKTGAFSMVLPDPISVLRVASDDFVASRLSELPIARDGVIDVGAVELQPGQPISGVVVDEEGVPISDFPVSIEPSQNTSLHFGELGNGDYFTDPLDEYSHITVESRTEADGTFAFAAHPQGSYTIKAGKRKISSEVMVNIGTGKVASQRLVIPDSQGQGGEHELRGRVVDEAGKPVEGVQVVLIAQKLDFFASFPQAVSGADGTFKTTASGFLSRVRVHSISHPDFLFGEEKAEARNGNWYLTVVVRKGRTLRGRVVDAEGKAVAGAFVGQSTGRELPVKTDGEGAFVLPRVPLSEATVLASNGPTLATVMLTPGKNEVRIALPAPPSEENKAALMERLFEASVDQLNWESVWSIAGPDSVQRLLNTAKYGNFSIGFLQFVARRSPQTLVEHEEEFRAALPADERAQFESLGMLARALSSNSAWREQARQWLVAQKKIQRPVQAGSVKELLRLAEVGAQFGEEEGTMWLELAAHIAEQLEPDVVAEYRWQWAPRMLPISGDAGRYFSQNWGAYERMIFLAIALRTGIEDEGIEEEATVRQHWKNLQQAAFEVTQLANRNEEGGNEARARDSLNEVRLLYAKIVARMHPQEAFELATTLSVYGQVEVFLIGAKAAMEQKQFEVARQALQSVYSLRANDPYDYSSLARGAAIAEQFDSKLAATLWDRAYLNLVESTTREERELFLFASYGIYARERGRQSPGMGRILLEREWAKRDSWNAQTTEEERSVNIQTMGEVAEEMTHFNLYRAVEMAEKLPEENQRRVGTLSRIARIFLRSNVGTAR